MLQLILYVEMRILFRFRVDRFLMYTEASIRLEFNISIGNKYELATYFNK